MKAATFLLSWLCILWRHCCLCSNREGIIPNYLICPESEVSRMFAFICCSFWQFCAKKMKRMPAKPSNHINWTVTFILLFSRTFSPVNLRTLLIHMNTLFILNYFKIYSHIGLLYLTCINWTQRTRLTLLYACPLDCCGSSEGLLKANTQYLASGWGTFLKWLRDFLYNTACFESPSNIWLE